MAVSGSNDLYASGMKMIARGVAALALLDDLAYFYYPLLRSRWRLCCLTDAASPLAGRLYALRAFFRAFSLSYCGV